MRGSPPSLRDTTAIVPQIRHGRRCAHACETARRKPRRKATAGESVFSAVLSDVGAGRLGELFVKATPEGLDRLTEHHREQRRPIG